MSRSKIEDVQTIVDISQSTGVEIEPLIFVASSPARLLVEEWDIGEMSKWATAAIDYAVKEGLRVNFACEDATRSKPEVLRELYLAALEHGASRFTIPDTVGICNPISTTRIVKYLREAVIQNNPVGLDWHGHDDRGLAVANSLAAIAAGADCIHTTIFGIGERCGNTALEPLIANLHYLYGTCYRFDLLPQLSEYSSLIFGETVHPRHPVIGKNAYSTAAGIHGAAILKALELKQPELIANIYAGVDPRLSNREVEVQVGPFSGIANIKWKASQLKFQFSESLSMEILNSARRKDRILTDEEILKIVETHRKGSECNEI